MKWIPSMSYYWMSNEVFVCTVPIEVLSIMITKKNLQNISFFFAEICFQTWFLVKSWIEQYVCSVVIHKDSPPPYHSILMMIECWVFWLNKCFSPVPFFDYTCLWWIAVRFIMWMLFYLFWVFNNIWSLHMKPINMNSFFFCARMSLKQ